MTTSDPLSSTVSHKPKRLQASPARARRRLMPEWKIARAKEMRNRPTPAEAALWSALKLRHGGTKWRRQSPMFGYIADFRCVASNIIVEVDGPIHDAEKDEVRDYHLRRHGFEVLRFTNDEVLADPVGLAVVLSQLSAIRRSR